MFTVDIFYSRFIYCSIVVKSNVRYNILFEEFTFCNCIKMYLLCNRIWTIAYISLFMLSFFFISKLTIYATCIIGKFDYRYTEFLFAWIIWGPRYSSDRTKHELIQLCILFWVILCATDVPNGELDSLRKDIGTKVRKLKGLSVIIILSWLSSSVCRLVIVWFRLLSCYGTCRLIYTSEQKWKWILKL